MDLKNTIMLQHASEVMQLTRPLEQLMEIDYFGHVRVYKNGSHFTLITHPNWIETFYTKHFNRGVCHKSYDAYDSGLFILKHSKDQYTHEKMREEFNIHVGITIVDKKPDYCDLYSFCSSGIDKDISFYLENMNIWYRFIDYFNAKGIKLIKKAELDCNILPKVLPSDNKIFNDLNIKNGPIYKNKISCLTKRETECASLVKIGLTTKEIASYLELSPKTVEKYIDSLKLKLMCKNKSMLIAKLANIILLD